MQAQGIKFVIATHLVHPSHQEQEIRPVFAVLPPSSQSLPCPVWREECNAVFVDFVILVRVTR